MQEISSTNAVYNLSFWVKANPPLTKQTSPLLFL